MIRLGVNATSLMSPLTGIGVYTYNLCEALQDSGECRIFYFYGYYWSEKLQADFSFTAATARGAIRYALPFLRPVVRRLQQWIFLKGASKIGLDIYHEPNFISFHYNGPVITTIHDLSVLRYPQTHPSDRVRFIKRHLPRAIETSRQIITVSRFVAKELISEFPSSLDRVNVVYNGLSSNLKPATFKEKEQILSLYNLVDGRYFLCVGTIEPRKNLQAVAAAYEALPATIREAYPLVVVGGSGWKLAEALEGFSALKQSGRLILTGYVNDTHLRSLYSGALAFLYPSLYEGFGLPVIEAMACGAPVITSNRASLPEVSGAAAIIIDPENTEDLASAMQRILEDTSLRQELVAAGFQRASNYSWDKCARETLAVYQRALG